MMKLSKYIAASLVSVILLTGCAHSVSEPTVTSLVSSEQSVVNSLEETDLESVVDLTDYGDDTVESDEEFEIEFLGDLQESDFTDPSDEELLEYADDLIKKLNDKYCKDTYTEEEKCIVRNRNASFAYVMLQSALMKMIDHCECFVFVHTSNSINDSKESTESIWLYNELLSASRIRARSLEDHRRDELRHTEMKYSMPVEMNGFVDLSIDDFIKAKDRSLLKDDPNVILETLYINKGYLK